MAKPVTITAQKAVNSNIKAVVVPLKALMNSLENSDLIRLLSSFSCALDADIEHFLQHRAKPA